MYGACTTDPHNLAIVMELMAGNLCDLLESGPIPWRSKFVIALQVAEGLQYLHNSKVSMKGEKG